MVILSGIPFRIHQKTEPVLKGHVLELRISKLVLQGIGHNTQPHFTQLGYRCFSQHHLELVFISETWYNSSMKEVRAGRKPYPTDLTDSQWEEIEPLYSGMRNRKWSKRELTNAVLYIVKTGCQWRQLPHDFPPYQTVYSFFSRGAKSGLWEKILAHLVEKTRKDAGKSAEPHYALIDSQSVKTVADNEARGIDGGKKQKGANGMPS